MPRASLAGANGNAVVSGRIDAAGLRVEGDAEDRLISKVRADIQPARVTGFRVILHFENVPGSRRRIGVITRERDEGARWIPRIDRDAAHIALRLLCRVD